MDTKKTHKEKIFLCTGLKKKDTFICENLIETFREYEDFVCSSSKNFECFNQSQIWNFEGKSGNVQIKVAIQSKN